MSREHSVEESDIPDRRAVPVGPWAVAKVGDDVHAVSRRCRHQLADLGKGVVDKSGCLICPWHQSKYDLRTGEMVEGPKGFLGYHGRTPRYARMVKAYSKVLRLRVAQVRRLGSRIVLR